ncbi:hypothetical protein [Paraburkholderia sp. C35]|uniref:hypothetical protein n=1 Tax=Paraburkholderia sp. C35 TaxID=2126993 RepID=UPI000D688F1E|nr:hypothetical protein [Paraburkholderia sp. C35]
MHPNLRRRRVSACLAAAPFAVAMEHVAAIASPANEQRECGFERPFSARSMWNARPLNPVLGTAAIPANGNRAYLEQGKYGSRLFRATSSDAPVVIGGAVDSDGPWVSDELRHRPVLIPRFPADTQPAAGTDGHCEIYDDADGRLHSFYGLAYDRTSQQWRAKKYCVSDATGSGWGSPSRPDGTRASGVSTAGGLLRIHEAEALVLRHALAVAADANTLRSGPAFPATLEDSDGRRRYTGRFPMGTLFMLPPDFEETSLVSSHARVIAGALKTYGARLVDQTVGTFAFYGEIGGAWSQSVSGGVKWNTAWAEDLTRVRDALRQVTSQDGWIDANGVAFRPESWSDMNLLSMRGPWQCTGGTATHDAGFDTDSGLFVFPECSTGSTYRKLLYQRDDTKPDGWFRWQNAMRWYVNPQPGDAYMIRASGFGECSATIDIRSADGARSIRAIKPLRVGETALIEMPPEGAQLTMVYVAKPPGPAAGIRLEWIRRTY